MKIEEYAGLLPEQKIAMIQQNAPQAKRDLAIYQAAGNVGFAWAFRGVNSWWNRGAWRSPEDYALIKAVMHYDDVQKGDMTHAYGPEEMLGECLAELRMALESAMKLAAPKKKKPARHDGEAVRAFWERYGQWEGVSEEEKETRLKNVALLWDTGTAQDVVYKEAFHDHVLMRESGFMHNHTAALKGAIATLGVHVPYLSSYTEKAEKLYDNYKAVFAQLYDKDPAQKRHLLAVELRRVAHAAMWKKAEESLSPEGRDKHLKRDQAYRNGEDIVWELNLPLAVTRIQDWKQQGIAFLHEHGVDRRWNNAKNILRNIHWKHANPFHKKMRPDAESTRSNGRKAETKSKNKAPKAASFNMKRAAQKGFSSLGVLKMPFVFVGGMIGDAARFVSENKLASFVAGAGLVGLAVAYSFNDGKKKEVKGEQKENRLHYHFHNNDVFQDQKTDMSEEDAELYEYESIRARIMEDYMEDSLQLNQDSIPAQEGDAPANENRFDGVEVDGKPVDVAAVYKQNNAMMQTSLQSAPDTGIAVKHCRLA